MNQCNIEPTWLERVSLLKILKSGLNRVNIEQVMAIQKFKNYYEIRGIDMIAGLQVSM